MLDALAEAFAKIPFAITQEQAEIMQRYYKLLTEANMSMNLTAIKSQEEAVYLHFLDSASPLFHHFLPKNSLCADVGTGAGFPGIVLAILRPDCSFVLMDARLKRVSFLHAVIQSLALPNSKALHMRAEDAGQNALHREKYEVVLSRAVAPLPVSCEYCLPLVRLGGKMIAYKGPNACAEAIDAQPAASFLGGGDAGVVSGFIPGRQHHLVCYPKIKPTPKAYPRKAGLPAKQPL